MARAAKAAAALPASGGNLLASLLTLSGSFRCLGLDNVETQAFDPSPVAKLMSGVSGPGEKTNVFEREMAPQAPKPEGGLKHARPLDLEDPAEKVCPEKVAATEESPNVDVDDYIPPTQPRPEELEVPENMPVVPKRLDSVFDNEAGSELL